MIHSLLSLPTKKTGFCGAANPSVRKMKKRMHAGFTLVEIMIVVAILGLLIAIGVPGFLQARNKGRNKTELANLKAITDNISTYAVNENQALDDIVRLWPGNSILSDPNSYIRKQLLCPTSKTNYIVSLSNKAGECTVHGTEDMIE
jgi:prepilin-type N-terminal cleavage/methylation domain-containing protein